VSTELTSARPEPLHTFQRDRIGLTGGLVLGLLTFSGALKTIPGLQALPVDLTVLLVLAAVSLSVIRIVRDPRLPSGSLVIAATFLAFGFGAVNASGSSVSTEKMARLFTITLVSALTPTFLLTTARAQRTFLATLATLAAAFTVLAIAVPSQAELLGRLSFGSDTIGVGRYSGVLILLCTCFIVFRRRPTALWLIGSLVGLYSALGSGSRGPLVAAGVAAVFAITFVGTNRRHRLARGIGFTLACLVALPVLFSSAPDVATGRIARLWSNDPGTSVTVRELMYSESLAAGISTPVGVGWGDINEVIGQVAAGTDGNQYTHNFLLEALAEGGWIPALALVVLIWRSLSGVMRRRQHFVEGTLATLTLFWVIAASFSGDLNGNRAMFIALGACLAARNIPARGERALQSVRPDTS